LRGCYEQGNRRRDSRRRWGAIDLINPHLPLPSLEAELWAVTVKTIKITQLFNVLGKNAIPGG